MLDRIKIAITLVFAAIAFGQAGRLNAADANPPERMTYQGFLVDGNGDPLGKSSPTNYDVVFRIYDAKSGGNKLWSEQQTVTVDNGYFSVLLGEGVKFSNESNENLSEAFDGADASDRFIGITVSGLGGADVEIAPRLRMVTSPYAFTATQARRLTDGSGNANFFKDNSALKLGAGATSTLTLPEAGGAILSGALTADLPGWGTGLQIDNGSLTTTMGAQNSSLFHFNTGLPQFYFNKGVSVKGGILSYNQDMVLGPSNNTDTYLKILSGSNDMHAYADNFYFKGASDLKVEIEAGSVDFRTTAPSFLMNKPLEVEGNLTVNGTISGAPGPVYVSGSKGLNSVTGSYGTVQTTGGGTGTWEGYSIDGRYVFMSDDNDHVGIYNDIDNEWLWDYNRTGNWHRWYNDGDWKMYLSSSDLYLKDGWFGRYNHNTGGLMGSYNNVGSNGLMTNPIYVIGNNYKPSASTLSNMYGVGFSDGGASFITGGGSGWGLYVAADGDARTFLSGSSGGNSYINKDGGKLGVGLDSPIQALDVNGIVSIRGKYMGTLNEHVWERPSLQLHVGVGGDYWLIGPQQEDGDGDLIYTYYNGSSYDSIAYLDPRNDVWVEDSDIRLKKNIEPMGSVVDRLNKLEPVLFNLIKHEEGNAKKIGFIAQDVKKIFPELVYDTEADRLGLNYHDYGVLSVKAIQELDETIKTQNERLKSRIGELESEIAVLKARLANSTTQEDRIAKLEELVSKIGQGE